MKINPFVHIDPDRISNPLTDRTIGPSDLGYFQLVRINLDPSAIHDLQDSLKAHLLENEWLVEADADLSRRFFLKYVAIESHTVCNQACYFCPVSISPRDHYFMPTEFFESIVCQVAKYRETIDGVSMINYNEPTLDRRFLDQIAYIKKHNLPPFVATNGTGLTPDRADAILQMGGLRHLSINLSTLDQRQYAENRGSKQLAGILRNLDYMKDLDLAPEMEIVVLGTADGNLQRDFEDISARFEGSRFEVKSYEIMDRAGNLPVGLRPDESTTRLCGCEQTGSRPINWLQINPQGQCVLCCQDYHEKYVVGDLNTETLDQVLSGDRIAQYRRWAYGIEDSPDDFICRKCIFARTR